MSIPKTLKSALRQDGIKGAVRYIIGKPAGLIPMDDRIDTLYYFFNNLFDATEFPKARGALRRLQECDNELLKLFHQICEKHSLCYWIDYGTLLGAKRHKGFIPWDDDTDVVMLREDYNRALKILAEEFGKYGIVAKEHAQQLCLRIGIGYEHIKTGIWIDIFPADIYYSDKSADTLHDDISNQKNKYSKWYWRKGRKLKRDAIEAKREKMLLKGSHGTEPKIVISNPEFNDKIPYIHNYENIFPLQLIQFEDTELYAPNNIDAVLKNEYGTDYMSFPRSGAEHHGTDLPLSKWAEKHGEDMEERKAQLAAFAEDYRKM